METLIMCGLMAASFVAKALNVAIVASQTKVEVHDEMKSRIGGELIRPNATRFGTVYMFLESFLDKMDKLRAWVVSKDWKESDWIGEDNYYYAEVCLSSSAWWSALEWVVASLKPLYLVLRYADTQKNCTLPGFKTRMMTAIHAMEAQLGEGSRHFQQFMTKVTKRVRNMETNTLMIAAAVLDPETHYKYNFSKNPEYASALTDALEKMASPDDVVQAIKEIVEFRECIGRFNRPVARAGASSMSPSAWWLQFGGEVPTLQKYALRIVSQCVSSSGCERNWSTFALVHTKIRNRLGYDKLHKLVYVHYNLKVRIQENENGHEQKEVDPCAVMLDVAIFDDENPIWDWLNNCTSEEGPSLDDISRSLFSASGSNGNKKRKRARVDDEIEIEESEDGDGDQEDEFEDFSSASDDDANRGVSSGCDDDIHVDDLAETSTRVEQDKEASAMDDRSGLKRKKRKVQSLYQRE